MKKLVIILIIVILIPILWFGYNNLPIEVTKGKQIKFGNELIVKIQDYKNKNFQLPSTDDWQTLERMGFKTEMLGTDPSYQKISEDEYELIYLKGFDSPYLLYNSKSKKWKVDFPKFPKKADSTFSIERTFVGYSTEKLNVYNCTIRINKDKTVNFIYNRDKNGIYGEHIGTIKKLNDTLFHISATMTIGQFYMESFDDDTIYIAIDSLIGKELDEISIKYSNKTQQHFAGYDKQGKPIDLIKIPINKKLFNSQKRTNIVTIIINRKSILSDKNLTFEIPFGSAASFTKGQKEDFYVVIRGEQLYTTNNPPLQTGHFKLNLKRNVQL